MSEIHTGTASREDASEALAGRVDAERSAWYALQKNSLENSQVSVHHDGGTCRELEWSPRKPGPQGSAPHTQSRPSTSSPSIQPRTFVQLQANLPPDLAGFLIQQRSGELCLAWGPSSRLCSTRCHTPCGQRKPCLAAHASDLSLQTCLAPQFLQDGGLRAGYLVKEA